MKGRKDPGALPDPVPPLYGSDGGGGVVYRRGHPGIRFLMAEDQQGRRDHTRPDPDRIRFLERPRSAPDHAGSRRLRYLQ